MSLKRNIDSLKDGTSDELHSVYLQILLKIEVIVVQNQHRKKFSEHNYSNFSLILLTTVYDVH